MYVTQLAVFAENRPGSVLEISDALSSEKINIRAMHIADTTDFGVVRMIVDRPDDAIAALRSKGFATHRTQVLALLVSDVPGGMHIALKALANEGIIIEYSYGFASPSKRGATIILRCRDQERAANALLSAGLTLLSDGDVQ